VRFAFIQAETAVYPVRVLCRALAVAPSGYYAWRHRPAPRRVARDRQLTRQLQVLHAESRSTYGRPRLHRALRARGERVGDKRVRRLMQAAGLEARGRRRFRVTTERAHALPLAANRLARRFHVTQPNTVWAADITALWTHEGWCYLAVVLDLASRCVVGWAVRATLEAELVIAALHLALGRRRVTPGLLHHSDRGRQYASVAYQRLLAAHGILPSMSRVGDCWDNAPVESFFSGLKAELLPARPWPTHAAARVAIADHIEHFYNRQRLHSAIGYQSPVDYESQHVAAV
jgi:transposase InsO family protein